MSIRVFLDAAFTPEEVQILVVAFEDTLKALGLVDREDAVTKLVAEKIIAAAKTGDARSPDSLDPPLFTDRPGISGWRPEPTRSASALDIRIECHIVSLRPTPECAAGGCTGLL